MFPERLQQAPSRPTIRYGGMVRNISAEFHRILLVAATDVRPAGLPSLVPKNTADSPAAQRHRVVQLPAARPPRSQLAVSVRVAWK